MRSARYLRIKAKNSTLLSNATHSLEEAIRGQQVPISTAEARFKVKAASRGWLVHRPSWPDFLVRTEEGLLAVEVKSKSDTVSKTQRETFNLLEDLGVKVYIWYDAEGARSKLVRWERGLALVKLGLA